jgi:hypothetical protein
MNIYSTLAYVRRAYRDRKKETTDVRYEFTVQTGPTTYPGSLLVIRTFRDDHWL